MSTVKFNTWQNTDGTENYKCRAWVNFNGTGTVAIRESGNVTSITDNATGDYTVNFTNAMPDGDYAISGGVGNTVDNYANEFAGQQRGACGIQVRGATQPTTSAVRIESMYGSTDTGTGARADFSAIFVSIIR